MYHWCSPEYRRGEFINDPLDYIPQVIDVVRTPQHGEIIGIVTRAPTHTIRSDWLGMRRSAVIHPYLVVRYVRDSSLVCDKQPIYWGDSKTQNGTTQSTSRKSRADWQNPLMHACFRAYKANASAYWNPTSPGGCYQIPSSSSPFFGARRKARSCVKIVSDCPTCHFPDHLPDEGNHEFNRCFGIMTSTRT